MIFRSLKLSLGAVHKWRLQALPPPYVANYDDCRWYSTGGPSKNDCRWKSLILCSISRLLLSKITFLLISCSSDQQKLKKLLYLVHFPIRDDGDGGSDASEDDAEPWWLEDLPHNPSSLRHPPCHGMAPRVGLLYRVMALVQDSIYHDATDFCGREGRPEDGLAPIKVASRASGLLKDDKGRIWCRRQNGWFLHFMETLAGAADEGFQIGHSSSLLSLIHQYQYPPIPFLPLLLLLLAQMHWWKQQQPHRSFHPQLPAQRSHSEITQTVVTFVGNSCSPLLAIVHWEKNQVGRPKHLRVNASPRVENKVSDFGG